MLRLRLFLILVSTAVLQAEAQPLSYVFQTVSTSEGLSSGGIIAIGQDKYGYLWMGTANGLNRFDGYSVKVFEHLYGDSTSVLPSIVRNIYSDSEGRLWISFMHGLMEYDFSKNRFISYGSGRIFLAGAVVETAPGCLHIGTSQGLVKLNTRTGEMSLYSEQPNASGLLSARIQDMTWYHEELYLLTKDGLVVYNPKTGKERLFTWPGDMNKFRLNKIRISDAGDIWLATASGSAVVYRCNLNLDSIKAYSDLNYSEEGLLNSILYFLIDKQQRVWVASSHSGLALFDPQQDRFRLVEYNSALPNSIPSLFATTIFQDRQGFIWLGTTGSGAASFHPDYNLFKTILPGIDQKSDASHWSRAAMETRDGKLWLATSSGLYCHDLAKGTFQLFQNRKGVPADLHDNSVRSLLCDKAGNLWIGTANGVNRLRPGAKQMDFLTEKDGLPKSFYLGIYQCRNGTIWFGAYNDGQYYLLPGETKARSIREHPVLKAYAGLYGHCIFEDSRGLLWFGLDGRGLFYYDPKREIAQHWERTPENDSTLVGNFVFSITEDAGGKIWVSTIGGLSCIDPATFQFTNYDRSRGLPGNRTTAVLADPQNRLWVGTPHGLLVLDSTRRNSRLFTVQDGLPTNEFSDMMAYRLRDGRFIYPSRHGFVLFNPEDYKSGQSAVSLLLSSVRVFNQPFDVGKNYESLEDLYLPPDQNFFSLEMTALNYRNPYQTWYAYKMEPYDQQWTYTRERVANYTNVPGGAYTFRYKATTDPNNWNVPEKTLRIRVGVYWYRSVWFWGFASLALALVSAWFVLRRIRYRGALFALERKAQALAKEKAQVQYENLSQQLNPHFLFNSLASLGSLIRFEPQKAGAFLEALSKMYRYMLLSRDQETVSLREEIAFAGHFIHLQQTRFGAALQVDFEIEEAATSRKIVPVTLQNLLENAIKHNTLDADEPLRILIFTEKNYLVVRNNIQRRTMVETSNKQGLEKLRSLYHYLTDAPLRVEEREGEFWVFVPLL